MSAKMDEIFYEIIRVVEDVTGVSASDMISSNLSNNVDARHILVNVLSAHGFTDTDIARFLKMTRPGVCMIRNNFSYRKKRYFVNAYYQEVCKRIFMSKKLVNE